MPAKVGIQIKTIQTNCLSWCKKISCAKYIHAFLQAKTLDTSLRWHDKVGSKWLPIALLCYSQIATSITSLHITEHTLAAFPQCLHYQVRGLCYWLTQIGGIVSTPALSHYLPDLVVSVFNTPNNANPGNPWIEIRQTLDQAGLAAQKSIIASIANTSAGGGQHNFESALEQNVFFKEADILGNPALSVLPDKPLLLPSTATPLKPYFQSMLDSLLWRGFPPFALSEQTYALAANITHSVGSHDGLINWGGIYPFSGKVSSSNDAKAAAVIAMRAGVLLTAANSWGHIYQSLSTDCGKECHAAVISEKDNDSQLQRIYPDAEHTCKVLGKTAEYGEAFENKTKGNYTWVLWRKYEGCVPGPGTYIGKTAVG